MNIKVDDIIQDTSNPTYSFGKVVKIIIENDHYQIWCWWAGTLEDLENKRYLNNNLMYCIYDNRVIVIKQNCNNPKDKYKHLFKNA